MLRTHSFIYHQSCIMFFSQYFSFPRQYHSTYTPRSSSSKCCSYQTEKETRGPSKKAVFRESGEHGMARRLRTLICKALVNMWRAAEGDHTQYSDSLIGWTIRDSIPGWGKSFSFTPKVVNKSGLHPLSYWKGPRVPYPSITRPRRDADRSLHLVPRLRIRGVTPLLPLYVSWRLQGRFLTSYVI